MHSGILYKEPAFLFDVYLSIVQLSSVQVTFYNSGFKYVFFSSFFFVLLQLFKIFKQPCADRGVIKIFLPDNFAFYLQCVPTRCERPTFSETFFPLSFDGCPVSPGIFSIQIRSQSNCAWMFLTASEARAPGGHESFVIASCVGFCV